RCECYCTPPQIQRYMSKISGPLMDRIDIQVDVPGVPYKDLAGRRTAESSETIRHRVVAARLAAYAVARDYDFPAIQTLFPCVVAMAFGPREGTDAYKKPLLFWPIEFGWGYPDETRSNLVIQGYGKSERISSLFGGSEGIKSSILQVDCYVEWNSFICVVPP